MESSNMGVGFMTVFAVSGSVVLLALQVHKRLLSDFMKKIESEISHGNNHQNPKKKVRFADDVMEPSSNNKEYRKRHWTKASKFKRVVTMEEAMPPNRQALYRGIMECRSLKGKGHNVSMQL